MGLLRRKLGAGPWGGGAEAWGAEAWGVGPGLSLRVRRAAASGGRLPRVRGHRCVFIWELRTEACQPLRGRELGGFRWSPLQKGPPGSDGRCVTKTVPVGV